MNPLRLMPTGFEKLGIEYFMFHSKDLKVTFKKY